MADVRNLSTDERSQRLTAGNRPQLWNVLTSQYFTGELLPGRRRMPLDTIGRETIDETKDTEIITYCGGRHRPESAQAAQRLIELGDTNVRTYKGGLDGWKAAGHSVETLQGPVPAASAGAQWPRADRRFVRALLRAWRCDATAADRSQYVRIRDLDANHHSWLN